MSNITLKALQNYLTSAEAIGLSPSEAFHTLLMDSGMQHDVEYLLYRLVMDSYKHGYILTGKPGYELKKIHAIKFVREVTGLGLREAKDAVELGLPFYPVQRLTTDQISYLCDDCHYVVTLKNE